MENNHDMEHKIVGARIREARIKKKLTQEKAAELAFLTSQFWSQVERGREGAKVTTYLRIAAVLDLTLDDLFYDNATNIRLNKAYARDALLADCTDKERAAISQAMLALKRILRENFRQ